MPCWSVIRTKLADHARLAQAMRGLGMNVTNAGELVVRGDGVVFSRNSRNESFAVTGQIDRLAQISRKYAEIGVREFAKRRGYSVLESDGQRMVLVNRRA